MASSNFIDHVKMQCRSGAGGAGSVHFYRDKFTPKGGPDGGDGGRGGHVILKGNKQLWTLLHLRYKKHIKADKGVPGASNNKTGAYGKDVIIEVPLGTIAKSTDTDEVVCEVIEHDESVVLLSGGKGGLGNSHFKSATRQSPRYAQPGEDGQEQWVVMELKLLADVGLVGFPNAGKSTFLAAVSAAKPKIADYAFTTLTPNLGMVAYKKHLSFVVADIPGIIEGAHQGKGLGIRFLRHIERNSVLLFMISIESDNIKQEYETLLNELKQYNPEILMKDRILAITKCDMIDFEIDDYIKKELPDVPGVFISSVAGGGIEELKELIWSTLNN